MLELKPIVEKILYDSIIPLLLLSHKDVTLYEEDPIEFIRK